MTRVVSSWFRWVWSSAEREQRAQGHHERNKRLTQIIHNLESMRPHHEESAEGEREVRDTDNPEQ